MRYLKKFVSFLNKRKIQYLIYALMLVALPLKFKSMQRINIDDELPSLKGIFKLEEAPANLELFTQEKPDYYFAKNIQLGGTWSLKNSQTKTAIIIPYRNRTENLKQWLYNMHPMFQRQRLNYTIFVVEQYGNDPYNKGILMNAAYELIFKKNLNKNNKTYDCLFFHDVDLVPDNDSEIYTCTKDKARHYSMIVGQYNYYELWPILVGGVLSFNPSVFEKVNGYPNIFYGWGGEDDNMYNRFEKFKIEIERPPNTTNYTMLKHDKRWKNPKRVEILATYTDYQNDGLNNVKYKMIDYKEYSLFTYFLIDVGKPDERFVR